MNHCLKWHRRQKTITEGGHDKCCYLWWSELCGKDKRKGWTSNRRKTGRMEVLVDENCVHSEVWWSASKSSLCNELTSWCSGQAFFSACNFLCNDFGSCGSLWAQVPYFPLVQCKKVNKAGSRSLCWRGIGLAPCYLDLAQPEFPCISVAPQWPGVFLWGKKVLWTLNQGEVPWKELREWEVLVGNV